MIAAALFLVLFNIWDAERAGKASDEIVDTLWKVIYNEKQGYSGHDDFSAKMPSIEIDGYSYIGILNIPSLELELPVMDSWDYERLKISTCLYSGSYDTKDMVICGHNYAKHFAPIKHIDIGANVYFITVDGLIYEYQVSNRENLKPEEIEEMTGKSKEDWDMTLFTCSTGGRTRCAVRCIAVY